MGEQGGGGGEIVSVHVGAAGVRVGAAFWELLCFEHALNSDGSLRLHPDADADADVELRDSACFQIVQPPGQAARARPRALFLDTADDEIAGVRRGPYRGLFPASSLVSGGGSDDAGCCFARGYGEPGRRTQREAMERMRGLLADCDSLQTVLLFHSRGGGTGSGLTARLAEELRDELGPKVVMTQLAVNPSPQMSCAAVEPYNAALSALSMSAHAHSALLFDNAALLAACQRHLGVELPALANANRLLAATAAALTAAARHRAADAGALADLLRGLVPGGGALKYLSASVAPLRVNRGRPGLLDVREVTRQSFRPDHHLADLDLMRADARYLAVALLYRGDVVPRDLPPLLRGVRNMGRFRRHCPDIQVSLCSRKAALPPFSELGSSERACAQLANSTAGARHWTDLRMRYAAMWRRRAFHHWYKEAGFDVDVFHEALDFLHGLEDAYQLAARGAV